MPHKRFGAYLKQPKVRNFIAAFPIPTVDSTRGTKSPSGHFATLRTARAESEDRMALAFLTVRGDSSF